MHITGLGPPNTTAATALLLLLMVVLRVLVVVWGYRTARFSEGLPPFLDAELLRLGRHLHVPCRVLG